MYIIMCVIWLDLESWRLVSKNERTSSALTAGRLEVFYNGSWGTFCSDGFSSTDASVSCWLLTGYAEVLAYGTVGSLEIGWAIVNSFTV